jgi:hypothetical protein
MQSYDRDTLIVYPMHQYYKPSALLCLLVGGCRHGHPSFVGRVSEDCMAGDQWACDLLMSLSKGQQLSK